MEFENNSRSKKGLIIGLFILLLITLIIWNYLRKKSDDSISEPRPAPTISVTEIATPSVTTVITPTVNYLTPFPQVSIPLTGTPQDLMKSQIESDKKWAENINKIKKTYPWIDQFPIASDYFFIYFQPDEGKFVGKIYDRSQEETLKETIKNIIIDKGVDINEYPIEWTYPE